MILHTIFLENFGQYSGRVELDLAPRRKRGVLNPVVLIGGKNGSGKTTLLEAIRLALYGRRSLGARVAQSEYDEFLRSRIHRRNDQEPLSTGAAVGLEFDYAENGVVHRYKVRRAWTARDRSVLEALVLEKDGLLIDDVPREEWHHFLQELIPPGVSQLFFFDGEKIQQIADGHNDDGQLANAVRGLLGIDLIGHLRTDLGLYLGRHQRNDNTGLMSQLQSVVREISALEEEGSKLNEEVAQLTATRETLARVAEQARRRFVAEGGDIASRRSQLEANLSDLKRHINRLEAELRDHANSLLPFTVAPKLTKAFRAILRQAAIEGSDGRSKTVTSLKAVVASWRKSNKPSRKGKWTTANWKDLNQLFRDWGSQASYPTYTAALTEVGSRDVAIAILNEAEAVTKPRVITLANELDVLETKLREVESTLTRGKGDSTNILFQELQIAEQRVGATDATLEARNDELKQLRIRHVKMERDRHRILEEQIGVTGASNRAALAVKVAGVLSEYEQRLLEHKIAQLRGEFVRCFNRLAQKNGLIADIRIDPESFNVTLIDRAKRDIPKAELSAGEKQIYAIAMLWALARTSGRALPMIVDTPLARLDSDHRTNLIERYFPSASHQVILLSTDTEVDVALVAALSPSISHAYHLEFDALEARTIVRPGYFFDSANTLESRSALQQA